MSFLDFLSSGLTAGTQGAAGYLEGQAKGRKEQEARAMQAAALLRQKHIDEQNDMMNGARLSGLNSTNALNARRQSPEFAALLKAALSGDKDALATVLATDPSMASALTRPEPPPRNIDPNSPEGIRAAIAKRPPKQESAGEALRAMKEQDALGAAEAWFNTDKGPDSNAAANTVFRGLRSAHPDWSPQKIMRAVQQGITTSEKGANIDARTAKLGGSQNLDAIMQAMGVSAPGAPKSPAASTPTPPAPVGAAPMALPPSVDKERYASDPAYKAWVDSKIGAKP